MKISQQIVGVNQRLGNTAVPNMQGTTRVIFDTIQGTGTSQTLRYFDSVSSRRYPLSNLNSNKFEVGESLAIMGFSFFNYTAETPTLLTELFGMWQSTAANNGIFNFYIGNQRVLKDIEVVRMGQITLGETNMQSVLPACIIRLETPIVIPPQIEFYATLRLDSAASYASQNIVCSAYGQGTLLNTKSTY
jgi:hypothetical protein